MKGERPGLELSLSQDPAKGLCVKEPEIPFTLGHQSGEFISSPSRRLHLTGEIGVGHGARKLLSFAPRGEVPRACFFTRRGPSRDDDLCLRALITQLMGSHASAQRLLRF